MKITDPGLKAKVLTAVGDADTGSILNAIKNSPKNAQAISGVTGVPLSTIYRKLAALKEAGLAYVSSFELTKEGKRQDLYRSAVTEVRVSYAGGTAEIELIPTPESANRLWFDLFSSRG